MKKLLVCLFVAVLCTTAGAFAQAAVSSQSQILHVLAANAACGATGGPGDNALKVIVDASTTYDCDTTGGGTTSAVCICDSGVLRGAVIEDIESYVLITLADQQSISATGAGNDVTLNAADDVILLPADDFRVTPTAGSSIINAVGAGEDVSLVAADDVLLTPTDALTAAVGGAAAVTTTAGAITFTAGGTTEDISLISVDQVIFDGAGGADELVIDDDSVTVGTAAAFIPGIASAPPVACAAGTKGAMYYDSDINKVCICNATNYVLMNDDSTTAGCS